MSSDIYAKPDLTKKVRYNRKVQDEEWEESEVVIYESADVIRDDHADIQSHKGGPLTEKHPPAVQTRPFRPAALCLGVLCFLMIMGIIFLSVQYISVTLEKDELQTRYDQLSYNNSQLQEKVSEKDELQTRYDQLSYNNSQLQEKVSEKDELQTRYDQLSYNNSQLQEKVSDLSFNHSQLQDEVKQLKGKIEGKWCPEGWKRFGCSCYFKSNERKNWGSSREYCQQRGADLVGINNKEEQEFVIQLNINGESWIGQMQMWIQERRSWEWEWKWVDRSPLTETFWASGLPYSNTYQLAATCCNQEGKWTQSGSNYYYKNWICEKYIT
ncbi:oxidized low-density lipoprotein receptor 1-like isoform X1 [Sebastes umbrosus]|uniref:oxidized low-density lipoprotein receptor 1-like isoform X1 n=1 Tax=Sebastes umbrosus TaxID=72105 RepID=UPI0018A05D71|nr:oxidized low-density lipoprotein receptor 1-like isoform X1 [Sebastes umbrosus]